MLSSLPLALAVLPLLILFGLMWLNLKWRERVYKLPLTTRLLRPPGESLRIKIEDLGDTLIQRLFYSFIACALIGIGVWLTYLHLLLGSTFITIGLVIFTYFAISLWNLGSYIRDCRLGFLGERAVGEELNQLLGNGWKVFHDVEFHDNPGQKPFNVDHVVVGTGGVFAIETKTRRKKVKRNQNDPKNEVIFNGTTLTYPWGAERFGIDQAKQRAAYLAGWLKKQMGEEISVQPVLALPGWSVQRKGKSDLRVISGREVTTLFRDEDKKQRLNPQTTHHITALLDLKCRDVEW